MKFIHTLKQDFDKTIKNIGFLAAVLLTCILGFTAQAYSEPTINKTYSIFEAIFTFDKEFIEQNSDFASVLMFRNGLTGYVTMFAPIIVAFPFMVTFCAERNNGLIRFTITRTGKMRYYLSKFIVSFVSGGLAMLLGMALFGAVMWLIFPSYKSYDIEPEFLEYIIPGGAFQTVARHLLSTFLYGAFSTLPAFLISSFCKNPYIITCLPFMLTYVWTTAISKLMSKAFEAMDYDAYDKISPFAPDSVQRLAYMHFNDIQPVMRNTLIFNSVYFLVVLTGFILIMNMRTDKGN